MKLYWLLAIFAFTAAAAFTAHEEKRVNGVNGWYVPQADGAAAWMSNAEGEQRLLAKLEQQQELKDYTIYPASVSYYLYTPYNPGRGRQIIASAKSINDSHFNATQPTRFVIHGWSQSYKSSMSVDVRSAWLRKGNYNVIAVDWVYARATDYATCIISVPKVGMNIAGMIDYLAQNHNMSLDTLHVIGHSMGAHVAGYAGKYVQQKIGVIVGLDPSMPLYSYNKPNKRLNSTDANYVESIQTDGGQLGYLQPIGSATFYPNGGSSQPGCALDKSGVCNQWRSIAYYAEAVSFDDFPSISCSNYTAAISNSCGGNYSEVRMGAITSASMVNGVFYVPVNRRAPYGCGADCAVIA